MGKIWYQQEYQNCSSKRGLWDDPVKIIWQGIVSYKEEGKSWLRGLKDKRLW